MYCYIYFLNLFRGSYGFKMDLLQMIADLLVYLLNGVYQLTTAPPPGGIFASLIIHIYNWTYEPGLSMPHRRTYTFVVAFSDIHLFSGEMCI